MPHISIEMYPGRNDDIKSRLAQAVALTVEKELNIASSSISVSITDVPKEEWKYAVYTRVTRDQAKDLFIKPGYSMD